MLWLTFFSLHLCVSVQLVCQPRDKHFKNEAEASFYCGAAINFALKTVIEFNPSCNCYGSLGTTTVPPTLILFNDLGLLLGLCNLKLLFSKADQLFCHRENLFHDSIKLQCAVFWKIKFKDLSVYSKLFLLFWRKKV